MKKIHSSTIMAQKPANLDLLRKQDGCTLFTENPSDKYNESQETQTVEAAGGRIKSQDLFLLFTADIITKKVLFTR
jgi:hypothetical protein